MRAAIRGARLITIAEAVRQLEIESEAPAKWLLRRIRLCEEETGAKLLVPCGKGRERARYRVSLVKLRKHLPELFDVEGEAAEIGKVIGKGFGRFERVQREVLERLDGIELKVARLTATKKPCRHCTPG